MRIRTYGTACLLSCSSLLAITAGAQQSARVHLSPTERSIIHELKILGQDSVPLVMAAKTGRVQELRRHVESAQGKVLSLLPEIDFLYVTVPFGALAGALNSPDLAAVQVAANPIRSNMGEEFAAAQAAPQPPTTLPTMLEKDNPYSSPNVTESLAFKQRYPTFDGRGVTIASVEGVHPFTPSLGWALTLDGRRVPKLADYVLRPPIEPDRAIPGKTEWEKFAVWRKTEVVKPDEHGYVYFAGEYYKLPEAKPRTSAEAKPAPAVKDEFRMAVFEPQLRREGPRSKYAVLWDVNQGTARVLASPQRDFSIADSLRVDRSPWPKGTLQGEKNGAGGAENVPYMLAADVESHALCFYTLFGFSSHANMTAGIAAGHNFLNTYAEGIAPAAQLVVHLTGRKPGHLSLSTLRSIFSAMADPRADLLTLSTVVGDGRLGDARDAYPLLANRLVTHYGKSIFRAAGNAGPTHSYIREIAAADEVVTVGAYVPNETYRVVEGFEPSSLQGLAAYSVWGPVADGDLKPNLVAPVHVLTAGVPGSKPSTPMEGVPEGFELTGGTSGATPNAAGHGALLISAAKQSGIPYDPPRLRIALYSTSKFLDGIEARAQGHGLIQVARAWEALKKLKNYTPLTFSTQAPVRTANSSELATPNVGRGLFEQNGWAPNHSGRREIVITRTSGPAQPLTYKLRWTGDTNVFTSPESAVSLRLNQAVKIPVDIKVGQSGSYSAILNLIDPAVDLVAHSVLCTVFVAEQLTQQNAFTTIVKRTAQRPGNGVVFVNVPPGTTALRVDVKQKNGNVGLRAQEPGGSLAKRAMYGSGLATWWMPYLDRESFSQTFERPAPGVWQLWLEDRSDTRPGANKPIPVDQRPKLMLPCDFEMTVTALEVQAVKAEITDEGRSLGTAFRNDSASLNAKVSGIGLGSSRMDEFLLKPGFTGKSYDVEVPAGTTKLQVNIRAGVADAQVLVLVFYPPKAGEEPWKNGPFFGDYTALAAYDINAGATKTVELKNPKAGKYTIVLDPVRVPQEGLQVAYRDVIYHPLFGSIKSNDTATELKRGDTKSAMLSLDVQAHPENGRQLVAEVGLFSDDVVTMNFGKPEGAKPTDPVKVSTEPVPVATRMIALGQRQ